MLRAQAAKGPQQGMPPADYPHPEALGRVSPRSRRPRRISRCDQSLVRSIAQCGPSGWSGRTDERSGTGSALVSSGGCSFAGATGRSGRTTSGTAGGLASGSAGLGLASGDMMVMVHHPAPGQGRAPVRLPSSSHGRVGLFQIEGAMRNAERPAKRSRRQTGEKEYCRWASSPLR